MKCFLHINSVLLVVSLLCFHGGCATNSLSTSSVLSTGEFHESTRQISVKTPTEHEKQGDTALATGNVDMAFIHYERAVRADPGFLDARQKLASLYAKRQMCLEAEEQFQPVMEAFPGDPVPHETVGRCFFSSGQYAKAEQFFRKAILTGTKTWVAHEFLGLLHDRAGRFHMAIPEYHAAIGINPTEGRLYNNLGTSFMMSGALQAALTSFMKAQSHGFFHPRMFNNLGLTLARLEQYDDALSMFLQAGSESSAYNNLGYIYLKQRKYALAKEAFERAIERHPRYFEIAVKNLQRLQMETNSSPMLR